MKNIFLSLIILFALNCTYVLSQAEIKTDNSFEPETYKHKFGATAGFTTGVGFSYQFKPNRLGIMVTAIPVKDEFYDFVSAGLTFRYDVAQTDWSNIFLYQGNHYRYNANKSIRYSYNPDKTETTIESTEQNFTTGLGLGLEVFLGKRFTYNLMAGYAIHDNFTAYKPTIETGAYFRF
jgi:hypothetical protein